MGSQCSVQLPVTQTVMLRRLRFFGHIIRSDSDKDHTRALNAGINDPPKGWRRPRGRPRQTWHTLSRMTSNNRTWGCGRPGTELVTVISGVKSKSQKRRRSCRGMLHDDDDDEHSCRRRSVDPYRRRKRRNFNLLSDEEGEECCVTTLASIQVHAVAVQHVLAEDNLYASVDKQIRHN